MIKIVAWFEKHEMLLQWISRICLILALCLALILGFVSCSDTKEASAESVGGSMPLRIISQSSELQDVFVLDTSVINVCLTQRYYDTQGIDVTRPMVFFTQFGTGYNNSLGNGNSPNPMLFNSFVYAFVDGNVGSYSYNGNYCWIARTGNRAYIAFFNESRQPICLNSPYTTSEPSNIVSPRTLDINDSSNRTVFYNPYFVVSYDLLSREVMSVDEGALHSHEYSAPVISAHLFGHDLDSVYYQGYVSAQSPVNIWIDGVKQQPRMQLAWLLPASSNYELSMPANSFFRSDSLIDIVNVLGFGAVQSHQTAGSGITVPFNVSDASAYSILNFMNYGTNYNYGNQYTVYRGFGSSYCPFVNKVPYIYSGEFVLAEQLDYISVFYYDITVNDGVAISSSYVDDIVYPSNFTSAGITLDRNNLIIDFKQLALYFDEDFLSQNYTYSENLGITLKFKSPVSANRIRYNASGSALNYSSDFSSVGFSDFSRIVDVPRTLESALAGDEVIHYIHRSIDEGVSFNSSDSDYFSSNYRSVNSLMFRPIGRYSNGDSFVAPRPIYSKAMRDNNSDCVLSLAFSSSGGDMYTIGYSEGLSKGQENMQYWNDVAYENGFNAGKLDSSGSTFWLDFLTGIISAPVSALTQGLNVDIMGFNLSTFFWALITLALVGFLIGVIIKLVK